MILTFELRNDGRALAVFFDLEGRDQLIERLAECTEPGDHIHLMSGAAAWPGGTITTIPFSRTGQPIAWVDIGIPGTSLMEAALQHTNEDVP